MSLVSADPGCTPEWGETLRDRWSRVWHGAAVLTAHARRELLIRGRPAEATVAAVRPLRGRPGQLFTVRVRAEGELPYDLRVAQWVRPEELEHMLPGDTVGCRVDPGAPERVVLFVPEAAEPVRRATAKILASGRRAEATVLAVAPIAAAYPGRDDPVLRIDLELHAWDEPRPWRARLIQPVPLAAVGSLGLGTRLPAAFFTVDRGESVAVDWQAAIDGRR
ncbi:hypothetical protein ACFYTF_06270 [Nocardia thailandica]|uniref:Uncharacterized protein n=1 Tax=Nocardia thailandica TaxID=257275 RepID=A0ABW6PJ42_9NOCA